MTLVTQPGSGADLSFFGLWFTGDAQREPTWYQVQALLHANQVNSPLYLAQQSIPLTWPAHLRIVGSAQVTLVEPDKFVFSWSLDGVAGGALYSPVTGIPSTIRLWYNPTESGWGLYDQLAQIQATPAPPLIATLAYLYDSNGVPRWIQGNNSSYVAGATLDAVALRPSCPSCVWLDAKSGQQSIGTLSYSGSGSNVQISTNLVFPAAMPGTWTRQQLLLTPLYQSP
jgi:hypothetical protein